MLNISDKLCNGSGSENRTVQYPPALTTCSTENLILANLKAKKKLANNNINMRHHTHLH